MQTYEDVLVAMNGISVRSFDDMRKAARDWKSDDEVELTILRKDEEITIFKSTGMAIQDVATAKKVYELARDKGIGVEVSITP